MTLSSVVLNPLKWKRVDQARLVFAVAFGALLILTAVQCRCVTPF